MSAFDELDPTTRTELEAAAFRRLLQHLDDNKDVQNIDLMILADFCRNCLSKWLVRLRYALQRVEGALPAARYA